MYLLEVLIGKYIVMVVNFVFCKMCFGLFEGMVLVVGFGGDEFYILELYEGVKSGMCVK